MDRVYNFAPGPACLPETVLEEAQKEFVNYKRCGRSITELSHRSKIFEDIINKAEKDLRDLLNIPKNYKVLFFQGGGCGQFAAVPMNLLGKNDVADYVVTGGWSKKGAEEAQKYTDHVNIIYSSEATKFTTLPREPIVASKDAAYVYYCSNETVYGVEFQDIPDIKMQPNTVLVGDLSSNFLSRSIDVSKFGLIFAGAQKNAGIAGCTVVIVREDLLDQAMKYTPTIFSYKTASDNQSLYHTPSTFSVYISGLVFQWIKDIGGLEAMEKINIEKAKKIYDVLDSGTGFYRGPVDKNCRSRMNIVFRLKDTSLEPQFVKEAAENGLIEIAGHRSVGGIRVSVYNAMPMAGAEKMAQFMRDFEAKHS